MSNALKMELQESIKVLHRKGWSHRRIASELGVNRRTVKRKRWSVIVRPAPLK